MADDLSSLLAGIDLAGHAWCYADLAEHGGFSLPAADGVYFHAVLHGVVRLASAAGGTVELHRGEAVFVLKGGAHALRLVADCPAPTLDYLRQDQKTDTLPEFAFGSGVPRQARVLSGRMTAAFADPHFGGGLPALLVLEPSRHAAGLIAPDALAVAGIGAGGAGLLTRLAALLLACRLRADPACREMLSDRQPDPIAQAMHLIAGNPSASWTVERLAHAVRMGRSSFAAHFTAQVGRAPMEVVAEYRMEQAAALLRKGSLKIAEVGELCGYGSEAAFSRRFSRHFGKSPSQMRGELRQQAQAEDGGNPPRRTVLGSGELQEAVARVRRRSAEQASPPGRAAAAAGRGATFLGPREG